MPYFTIGQNYSIRKFNKESGLAHSIVYRLMQDQNGMLWISTDDGINHFDGTHFRTLNKQNNFPVQYAFSCYEKSKDTILIASFEKGVQYYFKNKIRKYLPMRGIDYPLDFFQTKEGLFVTNRTFNVFNFKNNKVHRFNHQVKVSCLITTSKNKIIAVGGNSIYNYDISKKEFTKIKSNIFKGDQFYYCIKELENGQFILVTNSEVVLLDQKFNIIKQILKDTFLSTRKPIFMDKNGVLWISSVSGNVWNYHKSGKLKLVFQNVIVSNFFEDREKNLWLATYGKGLWCIPSLRVNKKPIIGELIDGLVFVNQGENRVLLQINQELKFNLNPHQYDFKRNFSGLNMFDKYKGLVYSDSSICVFSTLKYIYRINRKSTKFLEFENQIIKSVSKNSINEIFVTTENEIFKINSDFEKLTKLIKFFNEKVVEIVPFRDKLLISTNKNLYIINTKTNRIVKIYSSRQTEIHGIALNKNNDKVYIATENKLSSLSLINYKSKLIFNGSCNDVVCYANNIWFASYDGLYCWRNGELILFDSSFGLFKDILKIEIDRESHKLIAISHDEYGVVDIKNLLNESKYRIINKLFIEYIVVDDKLVEFNNQKIHLTDGFNRFQIKFTIPQFKKSNQTFYFFELNDAPPNSLKNSRQIDLFDLPYGENKIKIYAKDINNRMIDSTYFIIEVERPIYLKFWFIFSLVCLFVSFVILIVNRIFKIRSKKLLLQAKRNEYLLELKQKSLQNMLNPHFLNNAINSVQAYVMKNDQRKTLKYLSMLAKLMRINLQLLESRTTTLENELANIQLYFSFEKIRFIKEIYLHVHNDENLRLDQIIVPTFIIQPFVENAIWHGVSSTEDIGIIDIIVKQIESCFIIEIIDNGIGIDQSLKLKKANTVKVSRGTSIIKERFNLLNKNKLGYKIEILDISSDLRSGTKVTIQIPIE